MDITRRKIVAAGGAAGVGGLITYFRLFSNGEDEGDGSDTTDQEPEDNGEDEDEEEEEPEDNGEDEDEEEELGVRNVSFNYSYDSPDEILTVRPVINDNDGGLNPNYVSIETEDGSIDVDISSEVSPTWGDSEQLNISDIQPDQKISILWDDGENSGTIGEWYYEGPDTDLDSDFTAGDGRLDTYHVGGDPIPIDYLELESDGQREAFIDEINTTGNHMYAGEWMQIRNVDFEETIEVFFVTGHTRHLIDQLVAEMNDSDASYS